MLRQKGYVVCQGIRASHMLRQKGPVVCQGIRD